MINWGTGFRLFYFTQQEQDSNDTMMSYLVRAKIRSVFVHCLFVWRRQWESVSMYVLEMRVNRACCVCLCSNQFSFPYQKMINMIMDNDVCYIWLWFQQNQVYFNRFVVTMCFITSITLIWLKVTQHSKRCREHYGAICCCNRNLDLAALYDSE